MKILHIAPFNTSGVPLEFVRAERALGHESRLVTLGRSRLKFEEDICLDLPLIDNRLLRLAKKLFSPPARTAVHFQNNPPTKIPPVWQPTRFESAFIRLRESIWRFKIRKAIQQYDLRNFDIYQLDGGLGFYRDARLIKQLKARGKKIICCYTGSDLRVRGIIPEINALSDLNVSVEFDHQFLHPNLTHVPFPINPSRYPLRKADPNDKYVIITHAPTNRLAKGSDLIIPIVRELEQQYPVKFLLIENLPYHDALQLKAKSDIFIDQIGNLGYGISGLEALSMGIVTCSCIAPGFEKVYPDHPFVLIDESNLRTKLIFLIENPAYRQQKAQAGLKWVRKTHHSQVVVKRIHELAEIG